MYTVGVGKWAVITQYGNKRHTAFLALDSRPAQCSHCYHMRGSKPDLYIPFDRDWGATCETNANSVVVPIQCGYRYRRWLVFASNQWCVALHLCEGGFVSQVVMCFRFSCAGFSGVESLGNNWRRPSRTNGAGKSGQPLSLASQETYRGGDRMRAVWCSCMNLGPQSNGVCLPKCHTI